MAVVNDTIIAIPSGDKVIAYITVGDMVLAGYPLSADYKTVRWDAAKVDFSAGTCGGQQLNMVFIAFNGPQQDLMCTLDQPLMLTDGKLTTASRLMPGQALLGKDNQPAVVERVSMGLYNGGIHDIATNRAWDKTPEGHLLLANGLVVGDYYLQLYFDDLKPQYKQDGYAAFPRIGTKAYKAKLSSRAMKL